MDDPLPLLLGDTCRVGPWPQRLPGLLEALDTKHRAQSLCSASHPYGSGSAPQSRPGDRWATGAGTSLVTVLVGAGTFFRMSSGPGPSCFLERWMRDLSSALARPVCTHGWGGGGLQRGHTYAYTQPRRCPAGQAITFESKGP